MRRSRSSGSSTPLLRFATNRNMLAVNSSSTPAGGVEAEVVSVGKGDDGAFDRVSARRQDRIRRDVGGPAVQRSAQARRDRRARVRACPRTRKPETHRTSIQFSSISADTAAKVVGTAALVRRARGVAARARGRSGSRARDDAVALLGRRRSARSLRTSAGSDRPNERFVFSAHVQEPGANDNASGVGAAGGDGARRRARSFVRRRSTRDARSRSSGATRSRRRVATSPMRARGETVRWGVSLDMVGEDTEKTGGTFLIEKMPDPSAVWTRGEDHHTEWGGSPLTRRPAHAALLQRLRAATLSRSGGSDGVGRAHESVRRRERPRAVPRREEARAPVLAFHRRVLSHRQRPAA